MRRQWIAVAAVLFAIALVATAPAQALDFTDDNCAENPFVVDTTPEAQRVANGYNCPTVDLTIRTLQNPPAVVITDAVLPIIAKSITIDGTDVLDPGQRIDLVIDLPGSRLSVIASNGSINIDNASLKVHDILKLECNGSVPVDCTITVDLSDLIASQSFAPLAGPGDVHIDARGQITITNTNTHGGARLEVQSINGGITFLCGGAGNVGCLDPLTSGVAALLCPNGFPCPAPGDPPITFPTAADLKAVCFPQGDAVICNGGSVEKRFQAKGDIDVTGSTITSIEHMSFNSSNGVFKGAGAVLTSGDNIRIDVRGKTTELSVNLIGATITTGKNTIVLADVCQAAPAVCIDASNSDLEGLEINIEAQHGNGVVRLCGATLNDLGADFPRVNGDANPNDGANGYEPNVLDTGAECAPDPGATIN
jgi:hypothetical protein